VAEWQFSVATFHIPPARAIDGIKPATITIMSDATTFVICVFIMTLPLVCMFVFCCVIPTSEVEK